ncbi:MAG TPA: hypothetical protein VI322_02700 [Candidatus Saccharimonadia bacterium]
MSLAIALKNETSIVLAADQTDATTPSATSHFITLPNRSVVIISGNRAAVEPTIYREGIMKVQDKHSSAAVAQYIHAGLMLEVVPKIAKLAGRVEILVGGIDPIRHTTEPDVYYMDSNQNFNLTIGQAAVTLAGVSAIAAQILNGQNIADQSIDQMIGLAKECFTATRLRWPTQMGPHLKIAAVQPGRMQVYDF